MIADDEVAEAPLGSVVDRPVRDGAAPDARPRRTAAPGDAVGLWHDIRVSVTALRLLIEGMADGVIELDSDSPYLDRTKTHVTFLCELLKELPDRLAPVPAQFGPAMRPTDLGILLEHWSHAMHEAACAKELEIRVSVQYDLPPVTCRPDQISRVILNLVDNAIRHSPRKGIVALRALAQPGGVQVQVNDAGPGFRARCRSTSSSRPVRRETPATPLPRLVSRSPARSSRPMEGGCGSHRLHAAQACASPCRTASCDGSQNAVARAAQADRFHELVMRSYAALVSTTDRPLCSTSGAISSRLHFHGHGAIPEHLVEHRVAGPNDRPAHK